MAAAYGQAGAGTAARRTAYENYTYALKQQEIWQKKLRGGTLTPAEEMILNRNVYKSPEKAQQREANQQINDNLQWAQERRQKRETQLSEQEFNRSSAMQAQYGSYRNYLRGVYAGYDEAVAKGEQERAKSAAELRSESQALQQRIDAIDAQQRAAWTKNGAESFDAALKEERDALRERQLGLDYRADRKAQEEYKAGRQAARDAERENYAGWTQEQMQQRIDEIDAQQNIAWAKDRSAGWNKELEAERNALQRQMNQRFPGPLQKAARFAEDAATAFYDAGVAQSMSGFEMARNVAETTVNRGAAWALRDLANAQILKLPGGEKYAEKLRTLADRLATSYDYTDAQQWNDYYQSIMNEAMQDHSAVGTWIIQQLPSAGAMVNDLMFSTATGGTLTPLSIMGVRAGGSAMNDAHNEGATDTQALLIGLENAATEILSEKLFGGNPVYDEDAGLVNRAVAKLTKSKSVMRVLDSKAFDFVSEGLEEVVAELLEPTFQSMVLHGTLEGATNAENIGNAFLGGVFLAALGNLAGLPGGLTQAKQERQTRRWASILAENGAQSDSAEVREAAAVLQEKLDYGRTPDIEDIGRTLSAMDNAGQTEAAQEAAQDAAESRAYNQYERAVEDVQRSQAQYDRDTERQRIFQAERDGTITHEQAEAALDSLDQDEAINREEAQRVAARNVQSEAETAEAVGNARARQQSQQARNEAELERRGAARADAAIRSAAQQYGWGEQLTGAAAQSYADYNRGGKGELSAAEYAAAVNEARRKGADGIRLDAALRGAQGLPRTIIQTAWEAGRKNTENIKGGNNGTTVSDDGGKRNAGVDSGKQTGGVAEGAGRAEAQQGNRSWREEGRELEDRVRAAKQPGKSAKEIGIRNGSAEKSFHEVPRELWTPGLQKIADYARKNSVKDVHFFVGKIGVVNQKAQVTRYMNGVAIDGNTLWIRVNDNRVSPEQIARHEIFHSMADRAPNMLEAVQEQITKRLGREKIQALAQRYAEAYEGCYTEAEIEHYLEEICADAYAGIERFSGLSREAMDAIRSADGKAQSQKKADSARAPPEKSRYSIEKTEDGKNYVVVDRQQGRFIGLDNSEAAKLAKEIIQDEFAGQTLPLGEYAAATVRTQENWRAHRSGDRYDGAGKYVHDGAHYSDEVFRAKMRAAANLDEMLEASEYVGHSDDHKNHTFATDGFDYYKTTFVVGGRVFEGTFNIGLSDMGATFYGMTKITQVTGSGTLASARVADAQPDYGDLRDSKVARNAETVKQKYSAAADEDQRKAAQFDVIQNSNAAEDDYHTWIRSADEIRTLAETLEDPEWAEYDEYDPDYTRQMAEDAIQSGKITVYSSYKIGNGVFVTPSRMEAESYSANGKVYSKTVNVEDVAWIDPTQGQYAPVREADIRYSASEQYDYTKAFADQIDDWKAGKIAKNDTLIVGSTPDVFQQIGFNALPVTINQTHVDYAINGTKNAEHHIGEAMLKQLPRAMQSPVAVIASETQGESSVVALLPFIKDAKTVIIPVYVDGFGRQNSVVIDSNAITSIYGRKNAITKLLTNAIEAHNNGETTLFYLDKTKATALYQVARVTMPKMPDANNGFVASIRDAGSNVKPKLQNVTESQQFKRWFGDWQNHPETASKVVNEDGTPKIVYHQTENEFTVFDTRRNGAGTRDNQTPFGIFLKSSDRDIGLRGKNQMALYANIRNPLVAQNRSDLTRQLRSISPEYDALMSEHAQLDAEYKQKFEDAKNALVSFLTNWRKEHPGEDSRTLYGTPEFERVYDLEDSVTEEWTNKADDISLKAKEALTNALRQAGYDGIILARDEGSFGRGTDAYIALNPEQVKSATDNVGTFDRNNPDIRYSASEEQTEGQETASTEAQEKKGYTLDTIPKKAQTYLRKAQSNLLYQLERSMRMPLGRNARSVRGLLDSLTNEYLQTGAVTQKTMDKSFEAVYAEGMRLEKEFYERIRTLAPKLKRMEITPTAEEWAALDNPDAFRKRVKGTLNIVDSGGKSVNEVYEAMSKAAPEVFPRGVTGAAEQELALLMGARRMQLAEANIKSYDGTDAAIWKRTAKSDFEAGVKDLMGDLNVARRYAEAQRKTEKTYQGPQTAEEAMELYHELADQKRSYERAAADYLLTAEDRRTVGRLLRGDITPESVRGMENADAILAVYEAKADYELTALKIEEYKRHIGEERVKQAREALGDVSKYKDKRWGLQYARETQQRNVRDIAPAENAEAINRQYFNPVRKATAEATRLKNRMRERVATLDLSRHRSRGNRISEAAAVQILGEAQDNIRVLENSRGRLEDRDGKTLDEWQGIISQLWQENPNLDRAKIENAVKEFHSIYDELYRMMNETRVRNGYAPVNYRAGYFPHFGVGTSDGILNLMGMGMGIDAGIETLPNDAKGIIRWFLKTRREERGPDALPTEINGRTRSFRPGITWFANAQERTGFRTAYDAVLGFDRYVEGAANVICYTDAIRNLRTLASQVRYLSANDGLREQEDAIRARQDMTEGQKQLAIDDLKKNGKYALSLWAANLDEYTNLLANKKSTLDRDAESLVNRSVHSFLKKWQSRVAANMVALNPGSWLTNFGVIAQAGAEMKVSSVLKAMQQQAVSHWTQDGFSERSDFLTSRAGSDTLTAGWVDNASKVLSMPMEWIDTYSANVIVRARYMENLQRGMSEEAAMEEADDFAANVMADRSKGAMPTLFESRNPLFKMFTQFQLEVNNTFSYVFKDLPTEQRKKGVGALALALFKFCLQSWLYNELYESLIGRRPMLDPIDLAMEGAAGYAGYERNNAIRAALSGQAWFEKKDEDEHWLNATISLAGELGQELPFIGNLLGGGKLPYLSTFPDLGNVVSTITSEEWTAEQKRAKIWKELKDPVMYWAPPFGGGQIKKTTEAITAAKRGGSYAPDGTLQYPIYDETAGDQVQKWVTNLVFGKSSTKAAQEWVESGFKNLSRKETAAYQAMIQTDAGQRESYTFVTAMKNVKEKEAKLSMLFAYDLPESGKAAYYYEAIAEDSERERMDALREKRISNEEYVAFRKAYFSEYGTQAVSQERMNAILDKLSLPKNKKAELWRSCGKDWKEENNPYR